MQLLFLILFVSTVFAEEQLAKNDDKKVPDKKELKKVIEEPKSKTGKRDSSVQTGSFGINTNDEPFKPMINSPAPFVTAASNNQRVYYDKNQLTPSEGAGNAKVVTNPQAASSYRAQYSQVQQQQQPNKNHLRVNAKNAVIQQQQHQQQQQQQEQQQQQQQNQPSILYAAPQNPAHHYERIPPQQQPQQQQQIQLPAQHPQPLQRGQQKQIQYIIAIPTSYLRQLQQQLIQQQQQDQPSHLQVYKGQQQQLQPQSQQQLYTLPVYSIAGPLARDNQGSYRPFHRFTSPAVNDVSITTQNQNGPSSTIPQPLVPTSNASPVYVTQHAQIPASVLLSAIQSLQFQQQQQQQQQPQRPLHLPQQLYQQQQQPQIQLQVQQQQQQVQTQSPQLYYQQPLQQQQVQLKQSQPSHALTSPPVYGYQLYQQPSQQNQHFQHLTQQQQQVNVDKQTHRFRGVRPTANLATHQQYDSTAEAYESDEKAQLLTLQAPAHSNLNAHTHTNSINQQFIAQAAIARQQPAAPPHQVLQVHAPVSYEHVIPYNPQFAPQPQHQHQHQQQQRQPNRLHIPQHQHIPFVENLNNLPFSQGIHGPTPLPFLRLPAASAEASLYNLNTATPPHIPQSFIPSDFQPSFSPLGTPSKVTSFTNVLLQPFVGHHPSTYQTPEIGTAVAGSAESTPYINSNGGIRYGTHLYHPPTSTTSVLAGNKQHNSAAHPDPRVLTITAAAEPKITASSTKASVPQVLAGSPTIVKYP